ncbi:MAG: SIMPL domain-containing protein [Uliginosibacterium sp.]|nr:SIMPL domain-containing protein [Uliginosibacterium sp.]MBK9392740.1 SIMPL domain-containing protein [Uliginosibacterium sp.]
MTPSTSNSAPSRAIIIAAGLLAIGLMAGAFLLGNQTKSIGSGRATVTVKGLAEKAVKADYAEWKVQASATAPSFADALAKLRREKAALDQFLEKQGFDASMRREMGENVEPHFVEKEVDNRVIRVQEGYTAIHTIVISSKNLGLIEKAYKAALDYKAAGGTIDYDPPQFLVSNLEEVKISLISAATANARTRAKEFIKQSDTELGNMRSASQGAFYILPVGGESGTDDYGGTYDKTTIDKTARVVVTIEFNLK